MKTAYEFAAAKRLTAWAILHEGQHAGNLVAHYTPSQTTVTLSIFRGPYEVAEARDHRSVTGLSGYGGSIGFGYAVRDACRRGLPEAHPFRAAIKAEEAHRAGVWRVLSENGYSIASVIG